jgi:hypothetical protein
MRCAVCQGEIPPDRQHYTLRIDLFAGAEPGLSEEDVRDRTAEFEKLINQLQVMDAEELAEEAAKVFERYVFTLCPICRARFRGLLKPLGAEKSISA